MDINEVPIEDVPFEDKASPEKDPTTNENDMDYDNLIELYKKLLEYKNNLFKIDALLSIEREIDTQEELTKLRGDLLQAISYQEDMIKFTQNSDNYIFNNERLSNEHVDRLARCYFKPDHKWYVSKIESVDLENQEAEVTFIGFKDKIRLHSIFIKLIPVPDASHFEVNTYCEAIYSGDGKYYPCHIEKATEAGYHVKFRKYNNKEVVSLYHLRELDNPDSGAKNMKMMEDVKELKIPQHLKILPNDSEVQRKTKKKKIKNLKNSWKMAQIEKESTEKQSKWTNFADKAAQLKNSFGPKKTESIFRSPETIEGKVGVMGSGKGMTNFVPRAKINPTDNSHLSRLF